ncbi:glycosyltransferase family 2 protein (plasmid) [Pseudorhodobacter turbinis]|uniref:Glycosyltransferase family 2 protein n=1 Tax=Pseudorhodobacter turbinis TaxID=2500533 RepID=A0A4P8EJJ5_9RHOB|nr:glycosyltransferase family 2 protein [Pseudorhodobacter turbinis]QCO56875.1 glycosyltransferase family 2 protein [Pseudorhodobacter turbinis]
MRFLAVLTLRNEGAFLLEWLAHHQACGFTDFLVFSNECSDGTDLMLDRLQEMGVLTHIRNDGPHEEGPQWAALKAADKHPLVKAADWILVCDIDEFVNIHVGDRSLSALLTALPDATAIPMTWRMFGNAGVVAFHDTPVTKTFTRAAPAVLHWPWRAALFKTLFRNDGSYRKLGVHRPRSPDDIIHQRWFDGSGRELPPQFHRNRIFTPFGRDNYQIVQMNHYALGAMESYMLKCDRGRANRDASAFDMGYWVERNFCDAEDRSIEGIAPRSSPILAALRADATLSSLHHSAVAWRHSRFTALMQQEAWRSLFGRLLMCHPTRCLTAAQARLIWSHAAQKG